MFADEDERLQYLSEFLHFRKSLHSFTFLRILSRYLQRKTVQNGSGILAVLGCLSIKLPGPHSRIRRPLSRTIRTNEAA